MEPKKTLNKEMNDMSAACFSLDKKMQNDVKALTTSQP